MSRPVSDSSIFLSLTILTSCRSQRDLRDPLPFSQRHPNRKEPRLPLSNRHSPPHSRTNFPNRFRHSDHLHQLSHRPSCRTTDRRAYLRDFSLLAGIQRYHCRPELTWTASAFNESRNLHKATLRRPFSGTASQRLPQSMSSTPQARSFRLCDQRRNESHRSTPRVRPSGDYDRNACYVPRCDGLRRIEAVLSSRTKL